MIRSLFIFKMVEKILDDCMDTRENDFNLESTDGGVKNPESIRQQDMDSLKATPCKKHDDEANMYDDEPNIGTQLAFSEKTIFRPRLVAPSRQT
jgi:hypothetical protein